MGNKLYVGNLAFAVNEGTLESFFTDSGIELEKVELIRDVSSDPPIQEEDSARAEVEIATARGDASIEDGVGQEAGDTIRP